MGWWYWPLRFCLHIYSSHSLLQLSPVLKSYNIVTPWVFLYAKLNKMCGIDCIKLITWAAYSCDGLRYLIQRAIFRAHIRDCIWCVNILLALSSLLQYICWCLFAWGCSVCEKISLDPMTMSLVWWSTISDSEHIMHTGTWLRGDHFCKCWRSSCNCAVLQVKNIFSVGDPYYTKNCSIIFNYICFLVEVDNLWKLR